MLQETENPVSYKISYVMSVHGRWALLPIGYCAPRMTPRCRMAGSRGRGFSGAGRPKIEMLFLVLKQGARVQALPLSSMARVEPALAPVPVVAWRVSRLMRLGGDLPHLDTGLLFEPDKWQASYILAEKPVPKSQAPLTEASHRAASLGAFLERKSGGEPGVNDLWLGLQRVMDSAAGIRYAREAHPL